MCENKKNVIGYWMSKKKTQKLNWTEFSAVCRNHGFNLVEIDLERPLESQGPFAVFLHKLTDIIALAEQGDIKSRNKIEEIEKYIAQHPEMVVIDPLDNVRLLLDRYQSYSSIENSDLQKFYIFTPKYVNLTSGDTTENIKKLKEAGIGYPFVCKPLIAHGSKQAHKMSIIFSEKYISDCKSPCVAQRFVNHSAVLYKIYIVGVKYHVVKRPSLKNFYASDRETIFFDSHDVSKADSCSTLSILDSPDAECEQPEPDPKRLDLIVNTLRKVLGMELLGVDVVIENNTGHYAIIDINSYPGYDGYPKFFDDLILCIKESIQSKKKEQFYNESNPKYYHMNGSSSVLNHFCVPAET